MFTIKEIKNMKINKIISFAICLIISSSNIVYSETLKLPTVIMDGTIGSLADTGGRPGINIPPPQELNVRFTFIRLLGKNKSEIETTDIYLKDGMVIRNKKVKKKYNFFIYSDIFPGEKKGTESKVKGIYILDENDRCIGYCFFDQQYIYYRRNEPEILAIKTLTKNNNYLKDELVTPSNMINFYEKDHGDFIERYAINDNNFYMEAFYPKVLENNIKSRITNMLNFNYQHSFPTNTTPTSEDDEGTFSIDIEKDENNNPED